MINKEKLIVILNESLHKGFSKQDAYSIIYDYCIENNKKEDDINKFLHCLFSIPIESSWYHYLEYAINYYKRKFTIYEIFKLNHNNKQSLLYF